MSDISQSSRARSQPHSSHTDAEFCSTDEPQFASADSKSSTLSCDSKSRQEVRMIEVRMIKRDLDWWSQTGSNRRPPACKAGALPTELWPPQGSAVRDQGSDQKSDL